MARRTPLQIVGWAAVLAGATYTLTVRHPGESPLRALKAELTAQKIALERLGRRAMPDPDDGGWSE
ncbi:MAG: hypothetical protein ABW203_08560 [Novosphingobium sp.]